MIKKRINNRKQYKNAVFFSSDLNIGITIIKYRTEIKDSKIKSTS